ncbi:MAG TPA: CAP domain-containing protein [Mycobacteriales bacterium]|nr:CAP domain-containing protein [Mycobacteriales bacterium]
MRSPMRVLGRLVATLALALAAGATTAAVAPAAALASAYGYEAQFVADMNAARQANGLAPYAVAYDLTSVARGHSEQMASQQSLYHNPGLTSQVQNWRAVGENVGEGPTVSDIHNAFMNSPEHRANILDHDFTQVGVGVSVDKNGIIWVTEDFRQPMSSSTPTSTSSGSSSSSHGSSSSAHAVSASTESSASAPVTTAAPQPAPSPRAVLLHKLHELRHHRAARHTDDPVAQAFDYVDALATLTR